MEKEEEQKPSINIVDEIVVLVVMGVSIYILYRIWSKMWSMVSFTLKLGFFSAIVALLLAAVLPSVFPRARRLSTVLDYLEDSKTIRILWMLLSEFGRIISSMTVGRVREEWYKSSAEEEDGIT